MAKDVYAICATGAGVLREFSIFGRMIHTTAELNYPDVSKWCSSVVIILLQAESAGPGEPSPKIYGLRWAMFNSPFCQAGLRPAWIRGSRRWATLSWGWFFLSCWKGARYAFVVHSQETKMLSASSSFCVGRRRYCQHHRRFVLNDEDALSILVVPLWDIQILVALRSPWSSIWSSSGSRMHDEGLGLEIYSLTAIPAVIWWITSRNWWCSDCCTPILIRANYSFKDQECNCL